MNSPLISAIILNYRTPYDTVGCCDALSKQTIADQIESIIVDNHSGDESLKVFAQQLSTTTVIASDRNRGYGQGNNLGVERVQGKYLLFLNPDTALNPDAVEQMLNYLETHPEAGIVGPKLIFPDGTIRDSYRTFPTIADVLIKRTPLSFFFPSRMRRYLQWDYSPHETRAVDWLVGACLMIRRDLFEELHGFDPRFFLFFEDIDLCRRTWNAGKTVIYLSNAIGRDSQHRLSEGGMFSFLWKKTVRIHLKSACLYFWKWYALQAHEQHCARCIG